MAQVLVRSLDKSTVKRLKDRAKRHGRSLQAELKEILEAASQEDWVKARWAIERVRRMFKGRAFSGDSAELIREDRLR